MVLPIPTANVQNNIELQCVFEKFYKIRLKFEEIL